MEEPVAIVSMGCRLPGGVHTPEQFWTLLHNGGDAIEPFPESIVGTPARSTTPTRTRPARRRYAGRVPRDLEPFDAGFFGIAPP